MKKVYFEYISNFDTYTFNYAVYDIYKNQSDLNEIYENGFFSYTGIPEIKNYFYLYRSLRINLTNWKSKYLKENNRKYFYFGTVYGEKGKYKLNFEGLEFCNGNNWDNNLDKLKNWINNDKSVKCCDELKFNKKEFRN